MASNAYDGSKPPINQKNYFLMEKDVTDLIKKQGWSLKSLVARMTNSTVPVKNLPKPVIIVKQKGKDGKMNKNRVILNPKVKRSYYGDLLDKYSVVGAKTKRKAGKKVKVKKQIVEHNNTRWKIKTEKANYKRDYQTIV